MERARHGRCHAVPARQRVLHPAHQRLDELEPVATVVLGEHELRRVENKEVECDVQQLHGDHVAPDEEPVEVPILDELEKTVEQLLPA